jgi:hypothetical protein
MCHEVVERLSGEILAVGLPERSEQNDSGLVKHFRAISAPGRCAGEFFVDSKKTDVVAVVVELDAGLAGHNTSGPEINHSEVGVDGRADDVGDLAGDLLDRVLRVLLAILSAREGLQAITSSFVMSCQIGRRLCSPET